MHIRLYTNSRNIVSNSNKNNIASKFFSPRAALISTLVKNITEHWSVVSFEGEIRSWLLVSGTVFDLYTVEFAKERLFSKTIFSTHLMNDILQPACLEWSPREGLQWLDCLTRRCVLTRYLDIHWCIKLFSPFHTEREYFFPLRFLAPIVVKSRVKISESYLHQLTWYFDRGPSRFCLPSWGRIMFQGIFTKHHLSAPDKASPGRR